MSSSPLASVLALFLSPDWYPCCGVIIEVECGLCFVSFHLDLLILVEGEISFFFPLPVRCLIIQSFTSCEYDLPFLKVLLL